MHTFHGHLLTFQGHDPGFIDLRDIASAVANKAADVTAPEFLSIAQVAVAIGVKLEHLGGEVAAGAMIRYIGPIIFDADITSSLLKAFRLPEETADVKSEREECVHRVLYTFGLRLYRDSPDAEAYHRKACGEVESYGQWSAPFWLPAHARKTFLLEYCRLAKLGAGIPHPEPTDGWLTSPKHSKTREKIMRGRLAKTEAANV